MAKMSKFFQRSKAAAEAAKKGRNKVAEKGKTEDAAPASAGNAPTGQSRAPQLRYVDRIDCAETFADSINNVSFDGQSMRIEFGVTRLDDIKKDAAITGRRYPACRLVLTPAAAIDLINKMQQTGAALQQAGVVKANPPAGAKN
jgi:hypothetical protein